MQHKLSAVVEVDRRSRTEATIDQLDRLTRQLRAANARNAKAFDEGAAMIVRAMRRGARLEDLACKINWELVDGPACARTTTVEMAVPVEFSDSEEYTEPMASIPLMP
jgi:hypothetical protein